MTLELRRISLDSPLPTGGRSQASIRRREFESGHFGLSKEQVGEHFDKDFPRLCRVRRSPAAVGRLVVERYPMLLGMATPQTVNG
jgi:hypothetical protein